MYNKLSTLEKQIGWAALTFLVYTVLIGWQPALLLIIAIGFHESCHLWAAKKMKLRTRGFYLMPFIGGVAIVNDRYKRLSQQAFVVLMGPVGGGALAAITYVGYVMTHLLWLKSAALMMVIINLF